jgi:hypothetical protein
MESDHNNIAAEIQSGMESKSFAISDLKIQACGNLDFLPYATEESDRMLKEQFGAEKMMK